MKYPRHNYVEMLGVTPLAKVQDAEILKQLLSRQVWASLGEITEFGEPKIMPTTKGHFPGDEGTNLPMHRLYAAGTDYVRFPYVSTLHRTEHGGIVIKRDQVKFKVDCWVGKDLMSDNKERIFVAALRDRRFDATDRANDSALLYYRYDDPNYHLVLHKDLMAAEISIYSHARGSRVREIEGEVKFEEFFDSPFAFVDQPDTFRQYFERAFRGTRGPGQFAAAIDDVSKTVITGFENIASKYGYDVLESAVSYYNVAMWFKAKGFNYSFGCDEKVMAQFKEGIALVNERRKAAGLNKLSRTQESWLCVVQSLRPVEKIPDGLYLNGPIWLQDNIGPRNLWMNKPLTDKARELLAKPQSFCPPL
jgi:hypothetical protein